MARPRTFDEATVLDAATREFRVHGFAGTSTEQLCSAAGVRRSSLYNTFESKDELFIRALERSVAGTLEEHEVILTDSELTGAHRLRALLDLVLAEEEEAKKRSSAAGCMVVASRMSPDLGARMPRVQRALDRYLEREVLLVSTAVDAGLRDGSLRSTASPRDAALMIVSAISGLRVLSQSGTNAEGLRRVAELHLDAFRT